MLCLFLDVLLGSSVFIRELTNYAFHLELSRGLRFAAVAVLRLHGGEVEASSSAPSPARALAFAAAFAHVISEVSAAVLACRALGFCLHLCSCKFFLQVQFLWPVLAPVGEFFLAFVDIQSGCATPSPAGA